MTILTGIPTETDAVASQLSFYILGSYNLLTLLLIACVGGALLCTIQELMCFSLFFQDGHI